MKRSRWFLMIVAWPMAVVVILTSLPCSQADAALIPTDQVLDRNESVLTRAGLLELLAQENVRRRLEALGVDPQEAAARVAALSDREIRQIADRVERMPAGQDMLTIKSDSVIFLIVLAALALFWWIIMLFVGHGNSDRALAETTEEE